MIIICGPTSSGKTSLAVKLAKKFDLEIISADSRQIYKYMNYGTGKIPTSLNDNEYEINDKYWILDGIKIWMYDVVKPGDYFSVLDYQKYTSELIGNKGKEKIIVGGTGLYIESLINENFKPISSPDMKLRSKLERKSVSDLHNLIPKKQLNLLNNSDKNNPKRLIRLIEKYNQNDSNVKHEFKVKEDVNLLYLYAENDYLYERADKWADSILDLTIKETRELIQKGYKDTGQLNGIIYKSIISYISNEYTYEECLKRIKFDLHAYIRRQKTWFNRYNFAEKIDISNKNFDIGVFNKVESIYENE